MSQSQAIVVRVDRSKSPVLPEGLRSLVHHHPKLPGVYDLARVQLWRTSAQEEGRSVTGEFILHHLTQDHLLGRCLNLADGEVIIAQGARVFTQVFGEHQTVLLFGSAAKGQVGEAIGQVPCLSAGGPKVVGGWHPLNHAFGSACPVALFPPLQI